MKKLTALLLSVVLVLSLAACGSANKPASSTTQPETSAPTEQPATEPSESSSTAPAESEPETQPETGKTLVVYYSASGNTERVAKDIAEAAGADLFEIVPTEPYTDDDLDWTDDNSRVTREHEDESLRDVPLTTTEVPDWDSYDTVFIGYPIWWGIAAWPTNGFVSANDFTGKTVIPFATSSSSGMGDSGSILENLAGTGTWQEGQRFSSGVSSDDVQSWVNGLGL
jgi:flavodoxin